MTNKTDRFDDRIIQAYTEAQLPEIFAVRASNDPNLPSEILIYDEIGQHGIRAKDFAVAMSKISPDSKLRVRLNSPGGSAWDGLAMYNTLRQHPGGVEAVVDGLAASAASVIAMAADTVSMHKSASLMIHNSHGLVIGSKADMAQMLTQLSEMDTKMTAIYVDRTGKTPDEISAMMDKETWFTSTTAVENHFADDVLEAPKRSAKAHAEFEILALGAQLPDYDPDGDGDNEAEEAVGLIQQAIGLCSDAVEALTGTEPDEGADAELQTMMQEYDHGCEVEKRRRRLRLAQAAAL